MVCGCGRKIPVERLAALPGVECCVKCQSEDELDSPRDEARSRRAFDRSVSRALFDLYGQCESDDEVVEPDELDEFDEIGEAEFEARATENALFLNV